LKRQHKLYLIFWRFEYVLKVGKFATFSERPKAKSVLTPGGIAPWLSDQGLCAWTPLGPHPYIPFYRGVTLVFGRPPCCDIFIFSATCTYTTEKATITVYIYAVILIIDTVMILTKITAINHR